MRLLQIHALKFCYEPVAVAIEPHDEPKSGCFDDCLVAFTTIEEGDDAEAVTLAVESIASHLRSLKRSSVVLYPYVHLSSSPAQPSLALNLLRELERVLREAGFTVHRAPFGWYKRFSLEAAGHPLSELSRNIGGSAPRAPRALIPRITVKVEGGELGKLAERYFERFGLRINEEGGLSLSPELAWAIESVALEVSSGAERRGLIFVREPRWTSEDSLFPAELILSNKRAFYIERSLPASERVIERYLACRASVLENEGAIIALGHKWSAQIGMRAARGVSINLLALYMSTLLAEISRVSEGGTPLLPSAASPVQVYVAAVGGVSSNFISEIERIIASSRLRYKIDVEPTPLGSKIRSAGMMWAPVTLIVGEREERTGTLVVRRRDKGLQEVIEIGRLADYLKEVSGVAGYCG
ncbi:MAG: threonyl-tRNA synthetase editing domain-containing protein [Fervidicoccaceae archaeon]